LVVQAALFAGFLSAFLIELLRRLEQDPMDIIQDVLIYQTQMMRNSSLGPYVPPDFSPPEYIVAVNALFYASLGVMILAAFIAMLIKSWVREFDRGLRAMSLPEQRAKTREFRYLGMERWKLPEMVGILPFLIQIFLFLFSIGLVLFLFHISIPSFGVTTAIFGVGVVYYVMTTSISVFVTSSPFHSPLSRTLATVYQYAHAYFCPGIDDFLSKTMDTTLVTALGRFRLTVQTFLQKSRPYLEKDFVEPIAATTMDVVQLSVAASALQRVHDSAPNSEHSGALQWSVWQVAGSSTHRIPPLFNLPSWILVRENDKEYFSHLPPAVLTSLVAVWLRGRSKLGFGRILTVRSVLQRADNSKVPWARLVIAVSDRLLDNQFWAEPMRSAEPNDLTRMIRRKELDRAESLWLLSTLSELRTEGWPTLDGPFWIGICLAILWVDAQNWDYYAPPDIILLEAVMTLAAISCSPERADRRNILTSSREHPWLLLNLRNPNLINTLFEGTPPDYHKQLSSLLFLVVYALMSRRPYPLAAHYFTILTAKGDLPFCTSALTAVAPCMTSDGLATIGSMLVTPQTQELESILRGSLPFDPRFGPEELLTNYDHQLGTSEDPDPHIFAILLMFSKDLPSFIIANVQNLDRELRNPWLRLAARVVARLDIFDGFSLPSGLFHHHRVHNMIAALSLLRYTQGKVVQYAESLLLAAFLESRELAISSVALEYYMKTMISYSEPSAPPGYLSTAVSAVFNFILPDYQLCMGWTVLDLFLHRSEKLSVEWRRVFAEGFFALSRKPLLRPRGGMESVTPESELEKILTWEYFHEEEHAPDLTDSDFSGLDWMAMVWSLHLSQQSGRKTEGARQGAAQSLSLSEPAVDDEFVLRALCKLLDAAPYYQIIPIIPKLREFVQWFDDTELSEYRFIISTRVREAVRRHEEFQILHRFHKSRCTWYI
jgi:hypothetical protein